MNFKCINCGGNLKYVIKNSCLLCDNCLSSFNIEEIDISTIKTEEYVCVSCGAGLISTNDGTTKLESCPYCGSKSYKKAKQNSDYLFKKIIPFKIDKESAIWIAEQSLIQENSSESFLEAFKNAKITGLYLPYSYQDRFFNDKGDLFIKDEYKNRTENMENILSKDIFKWSLLEITPFSEKDLKPFNPIYLDNFVAYVITQPFIDNFFKTRSTEYFLVPVWIIEVKFDNHSLYLSINGQTGELAGEYIKKATQPDEIKKVNEIETKKLFSNKKQSFLETIHGLKTKHPHIFNILELFLFAIFIIVLLTAAFFVMNYGPKVDSSNSLAMLFILSILFISPLIIFLLYLNAYIRHASYKEAKQAVKKVEVEPIIDLEKHKNCVYSKIHTYFNNND